MVMSLILHSMVYIFLLICFAKASSQVSDFNSQNKILTAKILKQRYHYQKHLSFITVILN